MRKNQQLSNYLGLFKLAAAIMVFKKVLVVWGGDLLIFDLEINKIIEYKFYYLF